ncbi:MAG: zf-HC2 domain-containing protein [Burkholderiales bacterium]|nr:zf-HC2 domain-containing protein [Burkholderiales bacterium]
MENKIGIILNCRDVHALVSQGLDRKLGRSERIRMQMHLLICKHCTNFNQQMQLMRAAMRKLPLGDDAERG